jgi:choline dehydrogenase-like flavoprotein
MRSRLGGAQVGKKLSFNITSPITAQFAEPVRAYEGLQISHYLDLLDSQGFILETWFSPPAAMSLIMPGWFEDHYQNMLAYDHMASAGVLMGTEANASVRPGGLTGREISFTASTSDIRRAVKGLILAGEIYLASGAERVMPSTFTYRVYRDRQALQEMKNHVRDASDLMLGSSHPQGGNSLSSDPARGVVDPTFRVHGIPNLFVCDASVFPESVGVNPQLTVMALADYASEFVAEAGA